MVDNSTENVYEYNQNSQSFKSPRNHSQQQTVDEARVHMLHEIPNSELVLP